MTGKSTEESPRPLTDADYRRLAEFRYLLQRFLSFSESAAEETGLTPQHHQALLALKGFPDNETVTVGTLAERLGVKHHSSVGLIDRLAASGLVRRHCGDGDRRRVSITLTPKAERLLAHLTRAHRDELKRLAPTLRRILKEL